MSIISLRAIRLDDVPQMYILQLDPESNRLAGTIPRTREAFDAHWIQILAKPKVVARAILLGVQFVGTVSLFQADEHDHIGY